MRGRLLTSPTTVLSVDLRSLAAFRIGLGVLLLIDIGLRAADLTAHYTDAGVLPRRLLTSLGDPLHVSLYLAGGSRLWVGALFALTMAAAVSLLLGYRTRSATVLAWVLLVSLHNRNPRILNGGDTLLRLLLFWGMFLPLGARFSVDRRRSEPPDRRHEHELWFGGPSIALVLQIVMLYAFSATLKTGRDWWQGTAAFYALSLDSFTTPLGQWLSQFPSALRVGTYATLLTEWAAPILILSPLCFVASRAVVLVALVLMHLGVAATLRLNLFPWVDVVALAPLVPAAMWDRLAARASPPALAEAESAPPLPTQTRAATQVIALALIGYVALWNLQSVPDSPIMLRGAWKLPARVLRIDQKWKLFAAKPTRVDGWFVIPGVLEDGAAVDVYGHSEAPVSWERPARVSDTYRSPRWRKYLLFLRRPRNVSYREYYARYLCRDWNAGRVPGRALRSLEIFFMEELSAPPGTVPEVRKVALWHQDCRS